MHALWQAAGQLLGLALLALPAGHGPVAHLYHHAARPETGEGGLIPPIFCLLIQF